MGKPGSMLTPARMRQLDDLGFEWSPNRSRARGQKTFDERMKDLRAFKDKFGHCNVPREYEDDLSLASWCQIVRMSYWKIKENKNPTKKLTPKEIKQLEDIGFQWRVLQQKARKPSQHKSFEERIVHLTAFKKKHGHVRVTHKHDGSLASFCNHIRGARRYPNTIYSMKITEERINALDDLGFDWDGVGDNRQNLV